MSKLFFVVLLILLALACTALAFGGRLEYPNVIERLFMGYESW